MYVYDIIQVNLKLLFSGIPSEDTLSCIVRFLRPAELGKSLHSAYKQILETVDKKHIRIDGKEMRGAIFFGKKNSILACLNLVKKKE